MAIDRAPVFPVRWILIFDAPDQPGQDRWGRVAIEKLVFMGPRSRYGIMQKNLGMDAIRDGYYHCLDDDNLVHPQFFSGLAKGMSSFPEARAFAFGQQRWDGVGCLLASPETMDYGKIDNTMFVVHHSVIGERRYDPVKSGTEDFHFFRSLWESNQSKFAFLGEILSYYNYIRVFPEENWYEPTKRPELYPYKNHENRLI